MALIVLTDKCNLSCRCCFRPATGPRSEPAWSFAELEVCLAELVAAGQTSAFFSGGEPTLWRDRDVGLPRLLAATSQAGLAAVFVSNGHIFHEYRSTTAFLDEYFALSSSPLQIVLSIDLWHEGTWMECRSPALDSLLCWRESHTADSQLMLEVASIWCLEDTMNIPPQDFAVYSNAGVKISYLPLVELGRATESHFIPRLCPSGPRKDNLGSYGEVIRKRLGLSSEEWSALENRKLLGPCFAVDGLTLGLDRQYWLCNDRAEEKLHVASAGKLSQAAIVSCLARNPLVQAFRQVGVGEVIRQCVTEDGLITADDAQIALNEHHSFGISGRASCGLCKSLPSELFS